jgi:ribose transport system ATP-binding protein
VVVINNSVDNSPLLQMNNINKSFPGVNALKNVDFDLYPGEVCGLVGENGAGKSTLMNVLGGVHIADSGLIRINGELVEIRNSKDSKQLGISFIHQELLLFKNMDVATNIFIENLPKKNGLLDKKKLYTATKEILKTIKLEYIQPRQIMSELKIGEQQLVAIGRTLARETKILILDEPTSSLTNSEIKILFEIVNDLKQKGVAIVFITHRMEEIFNICDSVMIMRDGERILKSKLSDISKSEIINNMLGRELKDQYSHKQHSFGDELLHVKNLSRSGKLNDISFCVRKGELVGLYGLLGSGRSEVLRCIFGLDKFDSGEILFKGKPLLVKSPKDAIEHGIVMVTEDRHKEGLVLRASVMFNLLLSNLYAIKGRLFVNNKKEAEIAKKNIQALRIKTPTLKRSVQFLSGGNQQKVVLAKWLNTKHELFLMDEPTRGIDIGAKRELYDIIEELLAQGMAVIMVSSELPEILGLCDRVVVLKEGKVAANFEGKDQINSVKLLEAAMGG